MTTTEEHTINITLKVWRQKGPRDKGRFETIPVQNVETHTSFLEMLDLVNEKLTHEGKEPIAFDNDCREGICGTCGCVVDGVPHGPQKAMTLCQLHMRKFSNGDVIAVEPWRARAFKVIKDLMVDRSPLDKIIQSGGYVSVNTGSPQDANAIPVPMEMAEKAGWKSMIVVASPQESRYAQMVFNAAKSDDEMTIMVMPSPYSRFQPEGWWKEEPFRSEVPSQYLRLVFK